MPGAIVVGIALLVICVMVVVLLNDVAVNSRGEVVLGAFTAISALVSAYVGYQIGDAGKARAEQEKDNAKDDVARLAGELDRERLEAVRPQLKTM
jgi:threonine/homoserine/homoserine lactone efflux protein